MPQPARQQFNHNPNDQARPYHFPPQHDVWLSFAGWLRIARVLEDSNQVVLETTGAVYSPRISARHAQGTWQLLFPTEVAC